MIFLRTFLTLLLLVGIDVANAEQGVIHETTFNCAEWEDDGITDPPCDQLTRPDGQRYAPCRNPARIVERANYPNGHGGKGLEFYYQDGRNRQAFPLYWTDWPGGHRPEIWMRYYIRYNPDFKWKPMNWHKHLYFRSLGDHGRMLGGGVVGLQWKKLVFGRGVVTYYGSKGWKKLKGGGWHEIEVHLKVDTDGGDGLVQLWLDGQRILNRTDADLGTHPGFNHVHFPSNAGVPKNGGCLEIYMDDIKLVDDTYTNFTIQDGYRRIGSLRGGTRGDTVPPSPFNGLSIKK